MATTLELIAIDSTNLTSSLHAAADKLSTAQSDAALDFSLVLQIDAKALHALEQIANSAEKQSVRVSLCGVNVDVYKVLKLVKLTQRFSFEN